MHENKLSLHRVKPADGGLLLTQTGTDFNKHEYSRFKYGSVEIARKYGLQAADLMAESHPEIIFGDEPIIITSSAYRYAPTASHAIAEAFADEINYLRYLKGLGPTDKVKILRTHIIEGDFGTQTMEERRATLQNEPFHAYRELLNGCHLIFVDDVRITGVNEEKIRQTVEPFGLASLTFLYIAEMDAEIAATNPAIEN